MNKHLEDEAAEAANKVQMRLLALQDNIQNYREEYDFVVSFFSILFFACYVVCFLFVNIGQRVMCQR